MQRFWEKVNKNVIGPMPIKDDPCWEWARKPERLGYGRFRYEGKGVLAHRMSWLLAGRIIDAGQKILHRCDNRGCVKPSHLFAGTQADNIRDMTEKGRDRKATGERHWKAKLTSKDVEDIRQYYTSKQFNQVQLAAMYSVSQAQISYIVLRKSWR